MTTSNPEKAPGNEDFLNISQSPSKHFGVCETK